MGVQAKTDKRYQEKLRFKSCLSTTRKDIWVSVQDVVFIHVLFKMRPWWRPIPVKGITSLERLSVSPKGMEEVVLKRLIVEIQLNEMKSGMFTEMCCYFSVTQEKKQVQNN